MKVTVEGPCIIEADGPIRIEPVIQPVLDKGLSHYPYRCLWCAARFENAKARLTHYKREHPEFAPEPAPKMQAKPKGDKRKRQRGKRHVCAYCNQGYIRRSSLSRFCSDRHRHAWAREHGIKYPLPKGTRLNDYVDNADRMHIKAGATGVEVSTGHEA